jgi:asparagine synthase (glutamine-hydrolysing)
MYHLWHEDRTAAANSIENRVPFLDHRLVEFTYGIPPELYEELFWDKTILREAMSVELPKDLYQRPKVPFFVGEDERYTRRLVYSMLSAENNTLVEEALAGASDSNIFDVDAMRQIVADLPKDPEYTNVDIILDLVNMGLLSAMAKDMPDFKAIEAKIPVSAVEIGEWTEWEQRSGTELVERTPALDTHSIVRFGDGIRLVKREGGDPKVADEGDYYLMSNNELLFVLEAGLEKWVSFLRLVDGHRTIEKILAEANLQKNEVWKHLEESIEYGVLFPIYYPGDDN